MDCGGASLPVLEEQSVQFGRPWGAGEGGLRGT